MKGLTTIVVNYREPDLLTTCLSSVERALARLGGGGELIVVDNGSRDDSPQIVRRQFPHVRVIELSENRGFGAGVNAGLRASRGEWVFVINNDAHIVPDGIAELLRVGSSGPDIAAVAAQMRFVARPDMINSAGLEVDQLGVVYDRLLGAPIDRSEPQPVEVFGASGGAVLYRRAALEDVGCFDEGFFVFLEDADVAWRLRMRRWRSMYAPAALVYHHHSATAVHASDMKYFHVGRSRVRLLARNADTRLLRRYGVAMVGYDLAYIAAAALFDRTLAPLRGRIAGLREWRTARRSGVALRSPVRLAPVRGLREALRRRRAWRDGGTPAPLGK